MSTDAELLEYFQASDLDGSGFIDAEELQNCLSNGDYATFEWRLRKAIQHVNDSFDDLALCLCEKTEVVTTKYQDSLKIPVC